HRLRHLPIRLQPAQLHHGRHRRRGRHRRHAVLGVPALRLRFRGRHPHHPDRHHHGRRTAGALRARGVPRQPRLRHHPAAPLRCGARPGRQAAGAAGGGRMNSTATPLAAAGYPRTWQRYTMGQRLLRFALYLLVVAAIVQALRSVEIIPEFLYDAPEQMADLLQRMWPIDWSYYPEGVHGPLLETLHIATLGTILSVLLAVPVGLLAANNLTPSRLVNQLARLILVSSRSV